MHEEKISIYKYNGKLVGYYFQPKVDSFGADEYIISGIFQLADGSIPEKIEFNPQALPYAGTIDGILNIKHKGLVNIYVQRGRQPVVMTALGNK